MGSDQNKIIKKPLNDSLEVTLNHLKTDPDQEPPKVNNKKIIIQQ